MCDPLTQDPHPHRSSIPLNFEAGPQPTFDPILRSNSLRVVSGLQIMRRAGCPDFLGPERVAAHTAFTVISFMPAIKADPCLSHSWFFSPKHGVDGGNEGGEERTRVEEATKAVMTVVTRSGFPRDAGELPLREAPHLTSSFLSRPRMTYQCPPGFFYAPPTQL